MLQAEVGDDSWPFNDQCSYHIETSQVICWANQLTGFYIMGTLVVKMLRDTLLHQNTEKVIKRKRNHPAPTEK